MSNNTRRNLYDDEEDDEENESTNERTRQEEGQRAPTGANATTSPAQNQPAREPVDPFLQQLFQNMMGRHLQQQDMGMYVPDERLDEVINQLMIANPGPKGNPPAAKYHVQQLDEVTVDKKNKSTIGMCSICNDEFELYSEALKMPCSHYFHHDCIHPWLNMHNTCPLCRYELPTLDLEYEEKKYTDKRRNNDDYDDRRGTSAEFMYI